MDTFNRRKRRTHHGHAIKRLRQTTGIKQSALAIDMGLSQQTISTYEQRSNIEDEMLEKFAKALNVTAELIKNLEEDPVTVIIENNTFERGSIAHITGNNTNNYNDPIQKIIELSNEKEALYERILEVEKEKNALLEQLLRDRN